ncbi:MAG: exo-alpha-sialidase [Prevotellaceae bacterium]|nr:exo-alpha-sialidase [Prevotellaceae bacterium]
MRNPISKLALTLCLLATGLCALAQNEETTISLVQSEGTFYRYGEASTSTWTSKWMSETSPIVTIQNGDGSDTNNMSFDSTLEGFVLAEGGSHSSFSYTVSVEAGYVITGMSFSILGSADDITVTIDGYDGAINVTSEAQDITVSNLNTSSVSIEISSSQGLNENVTIYNWTLTTKPTGTSKNIGLIQSEGTFYRYGEASTSTWTSKWMSATSPVVTIQNADGSDTNNMSFDSTLEGFVLAEGGSHSSFSYTVSVEAGYVITGMSFSILGSADDITVTIDGYDEAINVTSEAKHVSISDLDDHSITVEISSSEGLNESVTIYNWTLTVEPVEVGNSVSIAPSTGTFLHYNGSSYAYQWTSTDAPTVTLANANGSTTNNMIGDTSLDGITMYEGSGSSFSYKLSVEKGYVITGISFTAVASVTDMTVTLSTGKSFMPNSTAQDIEISGISTHSITIDLSSSSGTNEGVTFYNWTVSVEPVTDTDDPGIIYSTEDEQHWYYIYSTSTNSYCSGLTWYYDSSDGNIHFGSKLYQPAYLWSFWEGEGDEVAIKNYTGGWVCQDAAEPNTFTLADDPVYGYVISYFEAEEFTIEDTNASASGLSYKYMHAQNVNSIIVHWSAESDNASMWNFEEVDVENTVVALESTIVEQGKVTTGIGNTNVPIIRSTIVLSGLDEAATLNSVSGKVVATDLADVKAVRAYFATNNRELYIDPTDGMPWREQNGTLWAEGTIDEEGNYTISGDIDLAAGTHYLWICLDISDEATEGNTVDATIESYTLNNEVVTESNGDPTYSATIFLTESAPLMPMDLGTLYYRIPAITTTADGSRLVILTDDRTNTNGDLPTHVYVVAQYSDDGGINWSEPVNVAGKAETGGDYGHGDASLITNRITGDIIGIMTSSPYGYGFNNAGSVEVADYPQAWKTIVSHDNGKTWEAPVDHTKELYGTGSPNPNWFAGFSGSGAGLQKRDGTLVSPFINKEADTVTGAVTWNYYNFMSKDGGDTWYVSGTSGTTSADEPKVLERNNGDLAISVRQSGYNFYNYTSDDGETWHNAAQTRFTTGIYGNACDGDYMVWCSTLDGNAMNVALQTGVNNSSRQNLSIALSYDEGETFESVKTICPRGAAYSSATVLPDGTLGVYYEENGIYSAPFTMRFVRFSLDWASDGKYKFTEEAPFHRIQTNVDYEMPDYGWNTVILPFDAEVPDGLTAYACLDSTVSYVENDTLKTAILIEKTEDNTLKGLTPYVLAGPEGTYNFNHPCEDWYAQSLPDECIYKEGALVGAFVEQRVYGDSATIYNNFKNIASRGGVGFNRVPKGSYVKIPAYNCYVELSEPSELTLFAKEADEIPTGIENTPAEAAPTGRSSRMYNLNGIPRRQGEKGIFIVDGKTVLIK